MFACITRYVLVTMLISTGLLCALEKIPDGVTLTIGQAMDIHREVRTWYCPEDILSELRSVTIDLGKLHYIPCSTTRHLVHPGSTAKGYINNFFSWDTWRRVEHLKLVGDLHSLDGSAFSGMESLKTLDLSGHKNLYKLPKSIFSDQNLPCLETVILDGCGFSETPEEFYDYYFARSRASSTVSLSLGDQKPCEPKLYKIYRASGVRRLIYPLF